jgi:hypothetical protein
MSSGGLKYVKDFDFPSDRGFTGSAGKSEVKGYMRGGKVCARKGQKATMKKNRMAKGTTNAALGGYMGPEREITVDDVKITTPARAKGGRAPKSLHGKMMAQGKKMGYKAGGYVAAKNTSAEFKAKRGPMPSMDHGVQPARRGANARSQQEREAGGTGRLKPGLKKGGKVCKAKGGYMGAATSSGGAELAAAALKKSKTALRTKPRLKKPESARRASAKGMPKNVKAKGGPVGKGGAAR